MINDIQCKIEHVFVLRTNGVPACVYEKTASRLGWDIIATEFVYNELVQQVTPPFDLDREFALHMVKGKELGTYIVRYNNEPAYKHWFDTYFLDITI